MPNKSYSFVHVFILIYSSCKVKVFSLHLISIPFNYRLIISPIHTHTYVCILICLKLEIENWKIVITPSVLEISSILSFLTHAYIHAVIVRERVARREKERGRKKEKKVVKRWTFVWEKKTKKKTADLLWMSCEREQKLYCTMRSKTKTDRKKRYWAVYIYMHSTSWHSVHFSSGHKYVESGKKIRENRKKKREKGYWPVPV